MKENILKKIPVIIISILVTAVCAALILFPKETSASVGKALRNCLNVLIPSLFAMMVMSRLMISSGLYRSLGRPFGLVSRYIFRIPEEMFPIFLISLAAGYPVGASLLSEACADGSISRRDAERMMCWCFGAGPAFIIGTVGAGVFGNVRCGTAVFISGIAANILIGIIMGLGRPVPPKSDKPPAPVFTADAVNSAVTAGGAAMLKMCAAVMFMSALLSIPESLKIAAPAASEIGRFLDKDPYNTYVIIKSLFEITNITYLKGYSPELLPAAAAAVSFGGISVFMQISAVCGGKLTVMKMIPARCAAAVISYIICGMLYGTVYTGTAVSAMASGDHAAAGGSPVSSVFLLVMVILLLSRQRTVFSE